MFKIKVFGSVGLIIVLFVSVLAYRADQLIYQNKKNTLESQSQTTITGLQQALRTELRKWILSQSSATETLKNSKEVLGFFVASKDGSQKVTFDRSEIFDDALQPQYFQKFFESRFQKKYNSGDFQFEVFKQKLSNPSQTLAQIVVLSFSDQGKYYGFLLSPRVFQKHLEVFKAPATQLAVYDRSGAIYAHSEEAYFGNPMELSDLFDESLRGETTALHSYKIGGNNTLATFSRLPQTNLILLYALPESEVFEGRSQTLVQMALIGIGFLLFTLGILSFFMAKNENTEDKYLEEKLKLENELNAMKLKENQKPTSTQMPQTPAADSKGEIPKDVLSALAHEMNPHLLAILGYARQLKEPLDFAGVRGQADSMIQETQKARNIVLKIFDFVGEIQEEKIMAPLEMPILEALKKIHPILERAGVKVEKVFQSKVPLRMSPQLLTRAFQEIFQNSVDAMERMQKKLIKIEVSEHGDDLSVIITDSGEGIDRQHLEKIFDPFFTTRSYLRKKGLGLSAVMGILKEQEATCKVQSEKGLGSKFILTFPKILKMANVDQTPPRPKSDIQKVDAENLLAIPDVKAPPVDFMEEATRIGSRENSTDLPKLKPSSTPKATPPPAFAKNQDASSSSNDENRFEIDADDDFQSVPLVPVKDPSKNSGAEVNIDQIVMNAMLKAKGEKGSMIRADESSEIDGHTLIDTQPKDNDEPMTTISSASENASDPDLEDLLKVDGKKMEMNQKSLNDLHVSAPNFQFQKRDSVLKDHQAKIPQNFEERRPDGNRAATRAREGKI